MWNLLGPGIEPMSPALASGFLSTIPPGKSLSLVLSKGDSKLGVKINVTPWTREKSQTKGREKKRTGEGKVAADGDGRAITAASHLSGYLCQPLDCLGQRPTI